MKNKTNVVYILNIIGKGIYWFVLISLVLIAGVAATTDLNVPQGYKLYSVVSGSMEPAIHVGSLVIVKSENKYNIGDIITFSQANATKSETVTHRINNIKDQNGSVSFETKGDANNTSDANLTPASLVKGKVIWTIPYIGYIISYAKTRDGLIFLIIIPATIIIYSELVAIKNEVAKLIRERRKRKLNPAENVELEIGEEEIKAERWYRKFVRKIFRR